MRFPPAVEEEASALPLLQKGFPPRILRRGAGGGYIAYKKPKKKRKRYHTYRKGGKPPSYLFSYCTSHPALSRHNRSAEPLAQKERSQIPMTAKELAHFSKACDFSFQKRAKQDSSMIAEAIYIPTHLIDHSSREPLPPPNKNNKKKHPDNG